jgi:MoaA/NifB/PqqE/SkfB family radical SAM enzyme
LGDARLIISVVGKVPPERKAIIGIDKRRFELPPLLANYYLTYKCNSRCTYCDIPVKPENIRIKETPSDLIIENLAALKRLGVKVVDFTGGEPLIYKDLPKVLKAAKQMGFYTSIANTGTLYPRMAEQLRGLVDDLKFSLSTTDSEEYRLERGIDGYEKVIESIKLAKSLGEQPSIIATATPESIGKMDSVIELAQKLDVVVLLGPVFDYIDNPVLKEDGIREIKRLGKLSNVCVNEAFLEFFLDGGNQITKPRCRAISSTIVISPDDHLLLPCYHMHDERLKIKHENGRSSLDELWRSPPVQEKRKKEGSWGFCQGCTIWCYFESSFLWPPDKYFFLNMKSKLRWGSEKFLQYARSKTSRPVERGLPGTAAKVMTEISSNPLSNLAPNQNTVPEIEVSFAPPAQVRGQLSDSADLTVATAAAPAGAPAESRGGDLVHGGANTK